MQFSMRRSAPEKFWMPVAPLVRLEIARPRNVTRLPAPAPIATAVVPETEIAAWTPRGAITLTDCAMVIAPYPAESRATTSPRPAWAIATPKLRQGSASVQGLPSLPVEATKVRCGRAAFAVDAASAASAQTMQVARTAMMTSRDV